MLPVAERSPTGHRRHTARHLHALQAARVMIEGHGWQLYAPDFCTPSTRAIRLPRWRLSTHATPSLHQRRHAIEATAGALQVVATAPPEAVPGAA